MKRSNSLKNFDLLSNIREASTKFENPSDKTTQSFLREVISLKFPSSIQIFGVHKKIQTKIPWKIARNKLLLAIKVPIDLPIIQIIGDSTRFSKRGTAAGKEFLHNELKREHSLILWGYTGWKELNNCSDVNELVNKWISDDIKRSKRSLACIVDIHTIEAIEQWGCSTCPYCRNFLLTYGGARFGDDIYTTDLLSDEALVLEGGVQTFSQIVNLLSQGKTISGIYSLRGHDNPEYFDKDSGQYIKYFSAIEFLVFLKNGLKKVPLENGIEKHLSILKTTYLNNKSLFNPKRPESITKAKLFKDAWKKFISEKLWENFHNCNFRRAS